MAARELTVAELEQRRGAAVKHAATSPRQVLPLARRHRRRVLRQLRLSPRDLDPIGKGYLDAYVRLVGKIDLIDLYVAEKGLIRADGEPQPVMKLYVALMNSARLALTRLEDHLRQRGLEPSMVAVLQGEAKRLSS